MEAKKKNTPIVKILAYTEDVQIFQVRQPAEEYDAAPRTTSELPPPLPLSLPI